jgi:hypothetical protein
MRRYSADEAHRLVKFFSGKITEKLNFYFYIRRPQVSVRKFRITPFSSDSACMYFAQWEDG